MRRLLLCLLLAAATPFSRASVITFDTVTPNYLGFTVEWGSSLQGGYFSQSAAGPGGPIVLVAEEPDNQFGDFIDRIIVSPIGAEFPTAEVVFHFPNAPAVSFSDAVFHADPLMEGQPLSITPTADGYGAHFVYDPPAVPGAVGVPESGSSLALLGLAAVACLGLRKLV